MTLALSPGKASALAGPRVRGALDELIAVAEAVIGGTCMTANLQKIETAVRTAVLFTSDHPRLDSRAWTLLLGALVTLDRLRFGDDADGARDLRIFNMGAVCAHLLVVARRDRAALDDILAADFREEFGSNPE